MAGDVRIGKVVRRAHPECRRHDQAAVRIPMRTTTEGRFIHDTCGVDGLPQEPGHGLGVVIAQGNLDVVLRGSISMKQYVGQCAVCGKSHGYFQRATYDGAPDGGVTVHGELSCDGSSRSKNESSGNRM